MTRHER